jgi:pyruvate/2-oxoglutarate dehydrogenase complex dihydrolipoamide dehydrogenase (E3) component
VTGGLRFTHVADYEARLVLRNALFPFGARRDYSVVPWVTFTDPELAHVGLTEREARERYGDGVGVWRRPFDDVDRAIADGETAGLVKLITDRKGTLVGGHILGYGAGTMIAEISLAMRHRLSVGQVAAAMHPYPTYPEAIRQASELRLKARFTGVARRVAGYFARR